MSATPDRIYDFVMPMAANRAATGVPRTQVLLLRCRARRTSCTILSIDSGCTGAPAYGVAYRYRQAAPAAADTHRHPPGASAPLVLSTAPRSDASHCLYSLRNELMECYIHVTGISVLADALPAHGQQIGNKAKCRRCNDSPVRSDGISARSIQR